MFSSNFFCFNYVIHSLAAGSATPGPRLTGVGQQTCYLADAKVSILFLRTKESMLLFHKWNDNVTFILFQM